MSTIRTIQSTPFSGNIGVPMVRRCSAYSLNASTPAKISKLPYICARMNPTNTSPVIAIRDFNKMLLVFVGAPLVTVEVAT